MNSQERLRTALSHKQPDRIPIDFGSTAVTGIHVRIVEKLREYYGLDRHPVKVFEPYQMLGEIEEDLISAMNIDTVTVTGSKNMFGIEQSGWHEFRTFWDQEILVPGNFNAQLDSNGDLLIHPEGDISVPASGKMPKASFFFDAIIRQDPIDDSNLNPEDNLEEFSEISDEDLEYWKEAIDKAFSTGRAVVAGFGGTAIGDIALVPAIELKHPKGIRDITEWYMSTLMRQDYLHAVFERQTEIAVSNMKRIFEAVSNKLDVVFLCGTDFGTQDKQFCDETTFNTLYAPYYRKMNDWIHSYTQWKTFKHSCGAVEPLMKNFIAAGFDIINPVQINAAGMDPQHLKDTYGDKLTFWGGGVDTQKVLSFGTPEQVKKQVEETCRIFGEKGGFVFNSVHNVQANAPIENVVAMMDTIAQINS